jgi:FdhE protein
VKTPTTDQELLAALREELEKSPELSQTITLHQELITARSQIEARPPDALPDRKEVAQEIDERVPLLRHWELEWDAPSFQAHAAQVCDIGKHHREELAPHFEAVRSLLIGDPAKTRDMVTAYLREGRVELPDQPDETRDVLSFVLIHSLHPFLRTYAAAFAPLFKDEKWYQRLCPICGAEPDFGYLEEEVGGLRLLCSRCDHVWVYKRGECTFCGNSNKDTFAYYLGDDQVYRLYVCDSCKRYLKVLDGRQTSLKPLLPLQRITTIGMDISARQEGYR